MDASVVKPIFESKASSQGRAKSVVSEEEVGSEDSLDSDDVGAFDDEEEEESDSEVEEVIQKKQMTIFLLVFLSLDSFFF